MITRYCILSLFIFLTVSCRRDTALEKEEAGFSDKKFTQKFIQLRPGPTSYQVKIQLNGGTMTGQERTVTMKLVPGLVAAHNASQPVQYKVLPDSCFSISNLTIAIPGNAVSGNLEVVFYSSKIDPFQKYILPLEIIDASGSPISTTSGQLLLRVLLANDHSGIYTDTVTCTTTCFPTFPCINYFDSVVTKPLTAINDSVSLMDIGVPGMHGGFATVTVFSTDSVSVSFDNTLGGILTTSIHDGYYKPANRYFNLSYQLAFIHSLKERLRRL